MRASLYVRVLLGILSALLMSCARDDPARAHLIQITAIEQRWEQAERLIARGEGMPQGMRGEARLSGLVFVPGEAARAIDVRAPCRALDKHEVVIELEHVLGDVAGDAPFEGQLELEFGTHASGRVVGRMDHVMARLGRAPSLSHEFAARQRAQSFQRELGIRALALGDDGVRVAELDPDGPAARAGLALHDRITRVADRPVQLPRDLLAPRPAGDVTLELERGPARTPQRLRVAWSSGTLSYRSALLALGFALGASLALLLGNALPSARWFHPRRKESWLVLCLGASLWLLCFLLADALPPAPALLARAWLVGGLCGSAWVCCVRLLRPTSRTSREADLAPLL